MSVTIKPPQVRALGDVAQDVGASVLGSVASGLAGAQDDVQAARIQDLSAYAALTTALTGWEWTGRDAAGTVTSVGGKLHLTADTHARFDGVSAELFQHGAVTVDV